MNHEPGTVAAPHVACCAEHGKPQSRSRLWMLLGVAGVLLAVALYFGLGTGAGGAAGLGGAFLLGSLVCPIVMGGMMFFMMRKR